MQTLINSIVTSPLYIALLGLISVFTVIYPIITKKTKQLRTAYSYFFVIKGKPDALGNLEVSYLGKQIDSLTITKIALWNRKSVIRRSDIASTDPLRICAFGSANILDVSIITVSDATNVMTIQKNLSDDSFTLDFEYLGRSDGAVFQVLSTGDGGVKLSGTIIGGKPLNLKTPTYSQIISGNRNMQKSFKTLSAILGIISILIIIALNIVGLLIIPFSDVANRIITSYHSGISPQYQKSLLSICIVILDIICLPSIIYLFASLIKVPKKLRIYDETDNEFFSRNT